MFEDIPDGFEQPINTNGFIVLVSGFGWKLFSFGVEVVLAPKVFLYFFRFSSKFLRDQCWKAFNRKAPFVQTASKYDIFLFNGEIKMRLKFIYRLLWLSFHFLFNFYVPNFFSNEGAKNGIDLLNELTEMLEGLKRIHSAVGD